MHDACALLFNLSSQSGSVPLSVKQRADEHLRVTRSAIRSARSCAGIAPTLGIIQANIRVSTAR